MTDLFMKLSCWGKNLGRTRNSATLLKSPSLLQIYMCCVHRHSDTVCSFDELSYRAGPHVNSDHNLISVDYVKAFNKLTIVNIKFISLSVRENLNRVKSKCEESQIIAVNS